VLWQGLRPVCGFVCGHSQVARNPLPLTWASMPQLARYIKKLPLHRLSLSSGDKGRPDDASRAGSLVSQFMQELHCWLSNISVRLHREGNKGVAVRLHYSICCPLLVVPRSRGRFCRWGGGGEGVGCPVKHLGGRGSCRRMCRAVGETGGAVEGVLKCGRNASWCTAPCKIHVRMSWRSVVCVARAEHRMPWPKSVRLRMTTQPHCTWRALGESMARLRGCRGLEWNSPLLSSRALESGRDSNQAEAGRQAQLRSRAQARLAS
jgi:hypothetical protein